MVNFIKENLLGSLKEFRNRFINPIQNGQCADSTAQDVRLMKKRAHILYEMLAGCVQVTFECLQWFSIVICSLWPFPYCFLKTIFFIPTEKRLHRTHQILAPETRICVVYQNIPVTVQTLQILLGALYRWGLCTNEISLFLKHWFISVWIWSN